MSRSRLPKASSWLLLCGALACLFNSSGCQTHVGGQTLPSAYYLTDDVQYFPAGPEFKLSRTVQAAEEYKAQRDQIENDAAGN